LFFRLDTALVLILVDLHSIFPHPLPLLPISVSHTFTKHSRGSNLAVCSHKFTFFWLRKTSVIVEISKLIFRVFVCASSGQLFTLSVRISSLFYNFCVIRTSVLSFLRGLFRVTTGFFFILYQFSFCFVLSMDKSYPKLFKSHCFKLSRAQSQGTYLSTCLNHEIPPNDITVILPASHAAPCLHSSLSS
jgi:hypothetical protein